MGWRQRAVVLVLAAAALVGVRYHRRLLHLARRLLTSIHTHTQHHHTEDTDPSPAPTLIGINFPQGTYAGDIFTTPTYYRPLWPNPTSFFLDSPVFNNEYFTFSFYSLLRSFTTRPAIHPAVKVIHGDFVQYLVSSGETGTFMFSLNDAKTPWGVILSCSPLPHIVKTGPLLGITPDLIGEVEGGREYNKVFYSTGLIHNCLRPNGDVLLVLGRHVNLDSLITLIRLSPIDYGWEVSAYTSHTVPNRLLAFFGNGMELGSFFFLYDDDGVNFVQDPYPTDQSSSYLQITIEFDQHLISHRILSPEEKSQWRSQERRYCEWPDQQPAQTQVGRICPQKDLSTQYTLSVDKEQRLWFHGSSSHPLTLKTLAYLAFARKYHSQLDQLASLPRGLESIGIPESIGREYRRQLAWATPQPPLILDLTASPPVLKSLFTSFPQDDSQCLNLDWSFSALSVDAP